MPTTDSGVAAPNRRRAPPGLATDGSSTGPRAATRAVRSFEEGLADGRHATDHDRRVRESIEEVDLGELSAAVAADASRRGVSFGSAGGGQAFRIDPIPRVIDAPEWEALSHGVAQRVRALELFVRDVYGDRLIVRDGVVPARCLDGAQHYEPRLMGT